MNPQAYTALVVSERKALKRLERALKHWGAQGRDGAPASLKAADEAWATWRAMAWEWTQAAEKVEAPF